ncbi:probable thionin-2.4 isoform X2 [Capsella rubella]|uniref:probable thionin-2.4 isoform X2 n=1 Tax=Capsella rubella TaxID=81985 RepID=UPI000CD57FEA|nr:probable thionin-2.4 isoform X2 [Capsella rubella]
MEGKFVVLSVFIMSLVIAQIQVEAKICCPSQNARTAYTVCYYTPKIPNSFCLYTTGCTKVSDNGRCPSGSIYSRLESSGGNVNEYCKLGCASSVCSAMTTLNNSDGSEIVSGAVEKCTEACSILCTKGFVKPSLETA